MRLHFLLLTALPSLGSANETDQLLSGIDGNQVRISMSDRQSMEPAPSFVSVCLRVPGAHTQAKGITTGAQTAKFVMPDHAKCIPVAPMAQRIVLVTRSGAKSTARSIAFTANLTGLGGQRLDINWITEVTR